MQIRFSRTASMVSDLVCPRSTQLLNLLNKFHQLLMVKAVVQVKKAFDTAGHELLVEKLNVYGIRGIADKWLQNDLTHRKQYVVIDDHSSDLLDMTCGVPEGSVLGPILFIIYINDICNVSDVVKCVLFADDTNIFCSERNLTDLQLTLNRELGKLFVWFSVNKLSLNVSKTNYILFRNRSADTDLHICINTINVTRVQSSKFLGIIIDENLNHTYSWLNLNFRKHCQLFTKLPNSLTMSEWWPYIALYSYRISPTAAKYGAIRMQLMWVVYICDTKESC